MPSSPRPAARRHSGVSRDIARRAPAPASRPGAVRRAWPRRLGDFSAKAGERDAGRNCMRGSNSQKRPRRHQTGRGDPFSLPFTGTTGSWPSVRTRSRRDPELRRLPGGSQPGCALPDLRRSVHHDRPWPAARPPFWRLRARPLRARRQPALAEKRALPLTGAPGEDGPGGCRSGQGLKPSGARGRLSGRQAARLPALTAGTTSLPAWTPRFS